MYTVYTDTCMVLANPTYAQVLVTQTGTDATRLDTKESPPVVYSPTVGLASMGLMGTVGVNLQCRGRSHRPRCSNLGMT